MYKCPNADCPNQEHTQWFYRNVQAVAVQSLDPEGTVTHTRYEAGSDEYAAVKCTHCGARAEWIDTRQGELFAVEPTLPDPAGKSTA